MKFVFVRTGAILETNNAFTIEQMSKSDAYKVYEEPKKEQPKRTTKKKTDNK